MTGEEKTVSLPEKIKNLITGKQTSVVIQFIKHLAIGGVGKVINLAGYPLLFYLFLNLIVSREINLVVSNAIVNIVAIIATFLLQKYANYRITADSRMQLVKFLVNSLAYYCVETTILYLFQEILHFPEFGAKLVASVFLIPGSFLSMKYWVFRKKKPVQDNQ